MDQPRECLCSCPGLCCSIQPALVRSGVQLSADGSCDHVFLPRLAFCWVSHLLTHPSSELLPPLLAGTPDPAWRMLLMLGVCPGNQRSPKIAAASFRDVPGATGRTLVVPWDMDSCVWDITAFPWHCEVYRGLFSGHVLLFLQKFSFHCFWRVFRSLLCCCIHHS